jgi:hypothetical protein
MKNYLGFTLLIVFCFACKFGSIEETKTANSATQSNIAQPSPANKPENPSINQDSTPKPENPLVALKKMKNKTATEIKLWSNKEIAGRLEKMMGKDFREMKEVWSVETPMEVEGDILMLSGCEAHNCGPNYYLIFIDTAADNINVHHILDDQLKSYKEKGEIKLGKKFTEQFEMDTSEIKKK